MSTIVNDSVSKCILGFHLGGIAGETTGCAHSVSRPMLSLALVELYNMSPAHLRLAEQTELRETYLGKSFTVDGGLHKKSPINYLPNDAAVTCYGNVIGRSTYDSSVIETPISAVVEEVTGVSNQWGPPKFKDPITKEDGFVDNQTWKPWYASLQNCCKPSVGFAGSDVLRAIDDYLVDLKEQFHSVPTWKNDVAPLDIIAAISGLDGVRFIDGIPSGTSVGYPIGGPKRDHLIELDPEEYPGISAPRVFTSVIMEEYEYALAQLRAGKSINAIFGSSLKDEPTKVTKDKVRVFQAAPIVLQLILRQFFLPIARFLSFYPLVSECAVGINAHGPEWNELASHMSKFGSDRILAGDYSKYDLRMPAQLTQASFGIMIEIAKWSGNYSASDIRLMEAVALEVTTPLVAFNGDLMRFHGTNPSGQNLTVYVNSIVNSLLNRLGFFNVYPTQESMGAAGVALRKELGRDVRFRDICALSIYGDDIKGSVREGFDAFNHVSFANFLAANDMKFTMPDKESKPVEFMNDTDADFLKRKNRYEPELGLVVVCLMRIQSLSHFILF
jgi:hypothetical protein